MDSIDVKISAEIGRGAGQYRDKPVLAADWQPPDDATWQRRCEADALGAGIARQIRGMARRAAEGDLTALEELTALEVVLARATREAAQALHRDYSWTEIAVYTGTSRQNVRQRFA